MFVLSYHSDHWIANNKLFIKVIYSKYLQVHFIYKQLYICKIHFSHVVISHVTGLHLSLPTVAGLLTPIMFHKTSVYCKEAK
jgi:hypothetical protein